MNNSSLDNHAFRLGFNAQSEGLGRNFNPFPVNSNSYRSWVAGWFNSAGASAAQLLRRQIIPHK